MNKLINFFSAKRNPITGPKKQTILQHCFTYRQRTDSRKAKSDEVVGQHEEKKVSTLDQGERGNGVLVRAGAEWHKKRMRASVGGKDLLTASA